jgi:hypothetical protein
VGILGYGRLKLAQLLSQLSFALRARDGEELAGVVEGVAGVGGGRGLKTI